MGSAATLPPPRLRCGQAFVEPFGWNGICGCKRARQHAHVHVSIHTCPSAYTRARQHAHVPVSMHTCPSACKPREGADGGAPSVPVRASHLNSSQTPPALSEGVRQTAVHFTHRSFLSLVKFLSVGGGRWVGGGDRGFGIMGLCVSRYAIHTVQVVRHRCYRAASQVWIPVPQRESLFWPSEEP